MPFQQQIDEVIKATATLGEAVAQINGFLQTGAIEESQPPRDAYITLVAHTLADYAWNGAACAHTHLVDQLTEFSVAVELLRGNFMLPDGSVCLDESQKQAMQRLANAAEARWQLDEGESIRVEGLAALAGVAEKTVRAATNPKTANPLPITKQGHWTHIEAHDALAWLARRNDFKPTHLSGDGLQQTVITDPATLAECCRTWRMHNGYAEGELGAALGWTDAQTAAYHAIEAKAPGDVISQLPPQSLLRLGKHLQLPDPTTFARQAYAVLALAHANTLCDQQTTN